MINLKKTFPKVLLYVSIALVLIQFIRPKKNKGSADTPNDITHVVQVPEDIQLILKTACYDCHSNHTEYPWYSEIMPLGLWLNHHVEDGKKHLNFSEYATYNAKRKDHKLEEIAEEVAEHEMPLSSYTLLHTNAKLSDEQIQKIVSWVKEARASL